MGNACNVHRKGMKYIQNFSWKTFREETIWETEAYMRGQYYNGPFNLCFAGLNPHLLGLVAGFQVRGLKY
jgi:hypothetical protein